ncbi:DUF1488 family protein [Verticiella sediminum]|nr:DUF1488 family protein [Verticiella sediminum]
MRRKIPTEASMPVGESDDAAPASTPVADHDGVRFTIFYEVHGPKVFVIGADVLMRCFGAPSAQADALLNAFRRHEAQIVAAAGRHRTSAGGLTALCEADFEPGAPPAAFSS